MKTYRKFFLLLMPLFFAAVAAQAKDIRVAIFKVEQLECENCARKVNENIRFERGVKAIVPNVADRTVTITYDADKTTAKKLAEAFKKFDYTAVFVKEKPYVKKSKASEKDAAGCTSGSCCDSTQVKEASASAGCCGERGGCK